MKDRVVERVWEIAEPVVTQEGLEMVDIEFRREPRGMVLRLFLDREGGATDEHGRGVSMDDLTRVSRQLGDLLDVHDAVPGAYTLEVSSPGIDRRLRRPDHFERYLGKQVRVRTAMPIQGRRVFTGVLGAVDLAGIQVEAHDGRHFIPFADIAQANYEPQSSGRGGQSCNRS
jgi:ribosome maturation factor RimP